MGKPVITVRLDAAMLEWLDSMKPVLGGTTSECIRNALLLTQDISNMLPDGVLRERLEYRIQPNEYAPTVISLMLDHSETIMEGLRVDQKVFDRQLLDTQRRLDRLTSKLYGKSSSGEKDFGPKKPVSQDILYRFAMTPRFIEANYDDESRLYSVDDQTLGIRLSAQSISSLKEQLEAAVRRLAPLDTSWRQITAFKDD